MRRETKCYNRHVYRNITEDRAECGAETPASCGEGEAPCRGVRVNRCEVEIVVKTNFEPIVTADAASCRRQSPNPFRKPGAGGFLCAR